MFFAGSLWSGVQPAFHHNKGKQPFWRKNQRPRPSADSSGKALLHRLADGENEGGTSHDNTGKNPVYFAAESAA